MNTLHIAITTHNLIRYLISRLFWLRLKHADYTAVYYRGL